MLWLKLFVLILGLTAVYFFARRVILLLKAARDKDNRQDSFMIIFNLLLLIMQINAVILSLSGFLHVSDDWRYIILGMAMFNILITLVLLLVVERLRYMFQNKEK